MVGARPASRTAGLAWPPATARPPPVACKERRRERGLAVRERENRKERESVCGRVRERIEERERRDLKGGGKSVERRAVGSRWKREKEKKRKEKKKKD